MTGASSSAITEAFYRVEVRNRATGRTVPGCVFEEGEGDYSRTLDGISEATFSTVRSPGCDECDCVPVARRDELAIIRSDRKEPAWVGPILRVVDDPETGLFEFKARDRLYWWEGAPAIADVITPGETEMPIVELIAEYIRQMEKSSGVEIDHRFRSSGDGKPPASDASVTAFIEVGDSIYSDFKNLSDTLFDFTVVGQNLYWGAPRVPITNGPALDGSHWVNRPLIDRDASEVVSQVIMVGTSDVIERFPPEPLDIGYGLRTTTVSDSNINTRSEALAAAEALYEANSRPTDFIVTGGGSLSPDFPLPMHELIPGRRFPVRISGSCLEASAELELFNLIVEFGSVARPTRGLKELRVAADFSQPGALGGAERQSAAA